MANMFDISNKKSGRSTEVSENEQMSRYSPMTSNAGDSVQSQGVNNDSSFENKDGAKLSGKNAYVLESRQETQETASPFTIPKVKKGKQELLEELPLESREWQDLLMVLSKSYRYPQSPGRYEFIKGYIVQNADRMQKFLEKRKELRQSGYAERDCAESFAFLYMDDDKQVDRICHEGLGIGNLLTSTIGPPRMGEFCVQVARYIDSTRPTPMTSGVIGKLLVFKVMKGKVKVVAENRSGYHADPTPRYDSHMAKTSLDQSPTSEKQVFELYQALTNHSLSRSGNVRQPRITTDPRDHGNSLYLYEYGEDLTVEPYPRHILPYAVVHFKYKDSPPSPRVPESPSCYSSSLLTSPPVPKFAVLAPKEVEDPEYVIWCGTLRVKDILDCQVKMVSTASQYKPALLGTVLNIRETCEMKEAEDRYFKELSCLRKSGEVYWKGWYINVAELRPRPDSKSSFQRLMNHLGRTNSMAVLKPENEVILLLSPNCSLTHDLGLTRPHHYPVMFHCIFLSKQSSKFKSPRYMRKQHLHESGSSTPRLDSGQMSPLSIILPGPASPAHLLSPPSGSFHKSPITGSLPPRDQLSAWTDALSAGRAAGQSAGCLQGEESVPAIAHNLLRLHRSLSADLGSLDSPGKSIPMGYDEGFLSSIPPTAHVNYNRLVKAFEIQTQIQDVMSPGVELLASMPQPPSMYKEQSAADVEQDDTITSSTSQEPYNPSLVHCRTTSTDATFSPVPSPEKPSEAEEFETDDVGPPDASFLSLSRESNSRSQSLYLPPPNIPEYKPTPLTSLYEPSSKRSRVDEDSRRYGMSEQRSSSSASSSGLYRTSPKVQTVGFTHVRSPADLPLPMSPADSSTDKLKSSPSPESSKINTADDMKNFLNASLEKKSVKMPSTPRYYN